MNHSLADMIVGVADYTEILVGLGAISTAIMFLYVAKTGVNSLIRFIKQ